MDDILKQLLECAPDAILAADRGGIIRYWNRGALMRDVTDRWQREKELQGRLADCQARLGGEAGG